jgi:hypothetical protein
MDIRPSRPQRNVHIALVIPDQSTFRSLRKSAYLIQDPAHPTVGVKLHILHGEKGHDPQNLIARHCITALALASPQVAALQYPEAIELGWSDDSARLVADD